MLSALGLLQNKLCFTNIEDYLFYMGKITTSIFCFTESMK